MESVHVFLWQDLALDVELREVVRERQLDDDAVDLGVAVQPADRGEQFVLRHVGGEVDLLGADPDIGRCLVLLTDVDARGGVVADQDGGQSRDDPLAGQRLNPLRDLGADLRGGRFAVEDPGGHAGILPAAMPEPDATSSVAEVTYPGEDDRHPVRLRGLEDLLVPLRSARVDHGRAARLGGDLQRVGEREERV